MPQTFSHLQGRKIEKLLWITSRQQWLASSICLGIVEFFQNVILPLWAGLYFAEYPHTCKYLQPWESYVQTETAMSSLGCHDRAWWQRYSPWPQCMRTVFEFSKFLAMKHNASERAASIACLFCLADSMGTQAWRWSFISLHKEAKFCRELSMVNCKFVLHLLPSFTWIPV